MFLGLFINNLEIMEIILLFYSFIYFIIIYNLLKVGRDSNNKVDKYGIYTKSSMYYNEDRKNYYLLILLIIITLFMYLYLIIILFLVTAFDLSTEYLITGKYLLMYIYIFSFINIILVPILNQKQRYYKFSFISLYWYFIILNGSLIYFHSYSLYLYIFFISILMFVLQHGFFHTGYYKRGRSNFLDNEEVQSRSFLSVLKARKKNNLD